MTNFNPVGRIKWHFEAGIRLEQQASKLLAHRMASADAWVAC